MGLLEFIILLTKLTAEVLGLVLQPLDGGPLIHQLGFEVTYLHGQLIFVSPWFEHNLL